MRHLTIDFVDNFIKSNSIELHTAIKVSSKWSWVRLLLYQLSIKFILDNALSHKYESVNRDKIFEWVSDKILFVEKISFFGLSDRGSRAWVERSALDFQKCINSVFYKDFGTFWKKVNFQKIVQFCHFSIIYKW